MKFLHKNQVDNVSSLDDLSAFVLGLTQNSEFSSRVSNFFRIFNKQSDCSVQKADFKNLVEACYYFVLPQLSVPSLRQIASEEIEQLCNSPQIQLEHFYLFFAEFVSVWLNNMTLESAIQFVEILFDRTTKLFYKNITKNVENKVDYEMQVCIHGSNQDGILCQEKLVLNSFLISQIQTNNELVSYRKISPLNEIIPLGFSSESALFGVLNNQIKNQKCSHLITKSWSKLDQTLIVIDAQEEVLQKLKDESSKESYIQNILSNNNLLNDVTKRRVCFQFLKNKSGENFFYNTGSLFYKQDEFEINMIDQIYKKRIFNNNQESQKEVVPQLKVDDHNFKEIAFQNLSARQFDSSFIENFKNQKDQDKPLGFGNLYSFYNQLPNDTLDPYVQDLIDYSKKSALCILLVGKPKTGKTTFCKILAKQLDIVHVELQILIEKIFQKVKDFEENPQQDEEGNPIEFLDSVEKEVMDALKSGSSIRNELLVELVNRELSQPQASVRGCVIDLPLSEVDGFSWLQQILLKKVRIPSSDQVYFSHVVELQNSDEEVLQLSKNILENPEKFLLLSEYDREVLKRPKVKVEGEEEEEEDEENKKPITLNDIVQRANESLDILVPELESYNKKSVGLIQEFCNYLKNPQLIRIENSIGYSPEQLSQIVLSKIGETHTYPLRPVAKILEAGGDFKELLSQNVEEGKVNRRWSSFYQVDCVELQLKNRILQGKAEFACEYGGRVFVFDNEDNQKTFLKNPKVFLTNKPQMPKQFNIAIVGPHKSGKKSLAQKLHDQYGWRIVDVEQLVVQQLEVQKNWQTHIPSNPDPRSNSIHPSDPEFKLLMKGGVVPIKDVIPIVLHKLGVPLWKKPPPPQPEGEEMTEEEKQAEEKRKEAEAKKKKKTAKKPDTDKDGNVILAPPEDLKLSEIGVLPEVVNQPPAANVQRVVNGLILIGYPNNEEQINILKECGINIDKVIVLSDGVQMDGEEEAPEPGKILRERFSEQDHLEFGLENELAAIESSKTVLKEILTEEVVKEISIRGDLQEVFLRIRTIIDPFYIRVDEDSTVRLSADVQETDEPIEWGEYGIFCPVTLKNNNWLVPGKEDCELQVEGKKHVKPAPPRIFFAGVRGSGIKTQLKKMNAQYKISVLEMKDEFLNSIDKAKQSRKYQRVLRRGFKPVEKDEEGNVVEDAEILEEPESFDRRAHEIETFQNLFRNCQEVFVNANYYDVEEERVVTPLVELMTESRKLPELIVFFKVGEKEFFERMFDQKKVEDEHAAILKQRKAAKLAEKEAARQAALESGEPFEEQEETNEDEEDPDAPQLSDMINEQKEKLTAQREADIGQIEALQEQFAEIKIPFIVIEANASVENVYKELNYKLKGYLVKRENKIESYQVQAIEDLKVSNYETSYVYQRSRYWIRNPLQQQQVKENREFAINYRRRIYYFESEEQRSKVMQFPLTYLTADAIPQDIICKPKVFMLGLPKSGKSELCKLLSQKLGIVRITVSNTIKQQLADPFNSISKQALEILKDGKELPDEIVVAFLKQRIQQSDCIKQGWILDGFPKTKAQAKLLEIQKIIPNCVLSIQLDVDEIKTRARKNIIKINKEILRLEEEAAKKAAENEEEPPADDENADPSQKFNSVLATLKEYQRIKQGYNNVILHNQLNSYYQEQSELECYFIDKYNNLRIINSKISKWGCFDISEKFIQDVIKCQQNVALSLFTHQAVNLSNFGVQKDVILNSLNKEFEGFCPVKLRTDVEFSGQDLRSKYLVYFNFQLYLLSSEQNCNEFITNPSKYIRNTSNFSAPKLIKWTDAYNLEYVQQEYDVVNLQSKKLSKGKKCFGLTFEGKNYLFENLNNMKKFYQRPYLYTDSKLPKKLPIEEVKEVKQVETEEINNYLHTNLGAICMKVMAQLGYTKIKYPTISQKETALKQLALSLKANNPFGNDHYRAKYQSKLNTFLRHSQYSYEINEAFKQKESNQWNEWDEEYLLGLTQEFADFLKKMNSTEKIDFFDEFIH